ncbi:poly(A) polymerase [Terrihabitans soli]|uniref:Poly(A) polymerase n=1 Tax=Terrihabitans soli TaxID=708113 RepID=A0A6S6QLB3_9HYPH|nr:CCA tRNA nucleotidyltransferase [Terrihabitans soli]BCJ90096.1 poly(A) polymerase [Terrihabitans soli]
MTEAVKALLADAGVRRMFEVFDGGGEETRIAGGAVRDALIGRVPPEVDFATTAVPEEIVRRAAAAGLKSAPTGIEHGTVTIIIDGHPFEITTLRRDVETDGRHAKVAFGRDWAEDAQRRDLTINGLFLDGEGKVHDFVGGEGDLKAHLVRFIGDAKTRIREDYLRILRFFRFTARYGEGTPDAEAMSAAISERHGLDQLSRERIRAELLKFLMTPRAAELAKLMADAGFLGQVLGGVARPRRLARLLESAPEADAVQRLGALALFIEDNAERLRERLRLSNEETARLKSMAGGPVPTGADERALKALLYQLGPALYHDRVLFTGAGSEARSLTERWTAPKFPVSAADLIARGVAKGPHLGAALARIEKDWIAAGFPDDKKSIDRLTTNGLAAV